MIFDGNNHAVFMLHYHLIICVKYVRLDNAVYEALVEYAAGTDRSVDEPCTAFCTGNIRDIVSFQRMWYNNNTVHIGPKYNREELFR